MKQHEQLNLYLDQVDSQIVQCYQDLKFKGDLITAELIKAEYLGENDNSKTLKNLIEFITRKLKKHWLLAL